MPGMTGSLHRNLNYMLHKLLPIPLLLTTALPVQSYQSQEGWAQQCFRTVYREEYVPGTSTQRGYVRSWTERVERPCRQAQTQTQPPQRSTEQDTNSCIEGTIIGGITGGALGGTLSTQENWIWSVPAGIVGGALLGCQIDGG